MVGLEYYRIQKSLTRMELAKRAGVSEPTVRCYERLARQNRGGSGVWLRFSDCLGETVEELMRSGLPELEDHTGRRGRRESRTANPNNLIARYRKRHGLSYSELAKRLGRSSRECARRVCAAERPPEHHIRTLAAYENLSVAEFRAKYSK